eukprot:scaffold8.g1525.t1
MPSKSPSPERKGGKGSKKAKGSSLGSSALGSDEKKKLAAELVLTQGRLATTEACRKLLEEEVAALRTRTVAAEATRCDVLQAQQLEAEKLRKEARRAQDERAAAAGALAALQAELAAVKAAKVAAQAEGEEACAADADVLRRQLSQAQREVAAAVTLHGEEQQRLKARAAGLMAELERANERLKSLAVRAGWQAMLRFAFSEPWMVTVRRERLVGAAPPARAGCALACTAGASGAQLVVWGGSSTAGIQRLDLDASHSPLHSLAWREALQPAGLPALEGLGLASLGPKLLAFGGKSADGLQPATPCFFSPATQQVVQAPPSACTSGAAPGRRYGHAMAFSEALNAVFVFGGTDEAGEALSDLWCLRLEDMRWEGLSAMASTSARGAAPTAPEPRSGAALAAAPDGCRLWLMGGRDAGGRCLGDLRYYDLQLHSWALVEPGGVLPQPRWHHVMACLGPRYLAVAGGRLRTAAGETQRLADTCIFDTASSRWDVLDADAFGELPAGAPPAVRVSVSGGGVHGGSRQGTRSDSAAGARRHLSRDNCVFHAGRLLVLEADEETGLLSTLLAVDLQPPDEAQRQQAAKAARFVVVGALSLAAEAEDVSQTSLKVRWVAPTARRDQILRFKLLLAIPEGRTRELYRGGAAACDLSGLLPGQEIVLAVKAEYEDGSHCWSEARAYKTLPRPADA